MRELRSNLGERERMSLPQKDVGVFKTSSHSGNIGVTDIGNSKANEFIIDLDEINALTMLGRNNAKNEDLDDILKIGQDGKNFQKSQLGLTDNVTGELDPELLELIRVAATGESDKISLVNAGSGTISIAVDGKGTLDDVLTFEGDKLNPVLAQLSDIEAICDLLPTALDLKNKESQIAVFNFDDKKNFFHGSDADVDSAAVKSILSGSSLQIDEAVELVEYALSADGQADDDIEIDFTGNGVILEIEASRDTTDTIILKGDKIFDAISTSKNNGNPLVDLKNKESQIAVFDFDEASSFFHGSDSDVDSADAKAILNGSRLDAGEAAELVELALSGDDPNVRYLGGDSDSAIVAIDASRDTTDTLIITGSDFDFI